VVKVEDLIQAVKNARGMNPDFAKIKKKGWQCVQGDMQSLCGMSAADHRRGAGFRLREDFVHLS
jgi:hypothetical protein